MLGALIGFELKRRLKQLSTYVYAVVLFAAAFFMMLASGGVFRSVAVASGNERVFANSPHTLFSTTGIIALFGLFTVAAVFGQAAYQDFGHNTWMIVFTTNVKKPVYLLGRFLGAFLFSCGLFLSIGAGQLAGAGVVYFVSPDHLGGLGLAGYLWPYVLQVWPMLFFTGAVFFSLAALTRRMAPVYVGVVVLVLGYLLLSTLLQDVQNHTLAALLDPFGFGSFEVVTRYWTPAERNRDLVSVFSLLGLNRAIWSAVGAALLALTVARFRTTVDEASGRRQEGVEKSNDATPYPSVTPSPTTGGWLRASASFAWMYFREVTRAPVYWAFVVAGLAFVVITLGVSKEIFGTPTLPVTYQVLELASASFRLFTLITVTFYAGELVWRERDVAVQDIVDATRVPTWVGYLAKLFALFLVALSLSLVVAVAALASQVGRGFFAIEPGLYLKELVLLDFGHILPICVLAFVIQVVVNQKYLGHFAMVVYFVGNIALGLLGVEDRLLHYGGEPGSPYSDMNGYGHFIGPVLWYRLYWYGFALVLVALAYVLTVRGREAGFKTRLRVGRPRLTAAWKAAAALGVLAWAGAGAFIFYNTHLLNPYRTAKDGEREQAAYEKTYKTWQDKPQPRITAAVVDFAIYPEQRRLVAKGTYTLENKTAEPIPRVFINLPDEVPITTLKIGNAGPAKDSDPKLGVYFIDLETPLAPGASADLAYELEFAPKGFKHAGAMTSVVYNGTFFNNFALPIIGYQPDNELSDDNDRKEYGFAPKERMAPRDDPKELQHNYIRKDSDFVTFKATVSTSEDQIAVAPGYLEKEWTENGRHFYVYAMDQPILNFFSVLSARYAVKRDEWNGVKLEIYYHPTHTWNLDRMMSGMKDALQYCTDAFGPYQHKQARILEFPRYQSFAQSFPNTIPYSEAVGFIARVRDGDPDDLDYPYYVTAHEIAHQWWAHQVVGANVRGATMTSESMAQYTALMVMKKKYGPEKMRRFLKFELDHYLVGRVTERKKELPLAQNENQMYIHYQKGSLAMYALQDFIGEDRVNRALKKYLEAVKFKGPPYTTAGELVQYLRDETPEEYKYLIDDLFETITLYDNRATSATMKKNAAGGWDVTMKVTAQKFRSDDKGNQTELDFDDFMDVGALDDKGVAMFLEKRKVKKGEQQLTFTVPSRPARVGVDPVNKLIDRNSEDNVTTPTEE